MLALIFMSTSCRQLIWRRSLLLSITASNTPRHVIGRLLHKFERDPYMASVIFLCCILLLACCCSEGEGFRLLRDVRPAAASSTSYSIKEHFIMNLAYSGPSRRGRGH